MLKAFAVIACAASANVAWAQGYSIPDQAGRPAGMGEAYTAASDGPESIFYNPAGLARVSRPSVMFGAYYVRSKTTFEGDAFRDEADGAFVLPHAYVAVPLNDRVTAGLGLHTPFGLGVDWDSELPLAQVADRTLLEMPTVSPTLSFRASDRFRIGAAVNIHVASLERETVVPLGGGDTGRLELELDDVAVNFTLGCQFDIDGDHSLGLLIRTPFTLEFDGDATFRTPAGRLDADASLRLDQPLMVALGWAGRVHERLLLTADVHYVDWGRLDEVVLNSRSPVLAGLPPERFEYTRAFSVRVGAEFAVTERLDLRLGGGFFTSVGADETLTPLVPDHDALLLTGGFGYTLGRARFDLAVQWIDRLDRSSDRSVNAPPGDFRADTIGVMASVTFTF